MSDDQPVLKIVPLTADDAAVGGAGEAVAEGFWLRLFDALGWRPWLEAVADRLVVLLFGGEDGHEG